MDSDEELADLANDGPESPKLANMNEFSPGTLEKFTIRKLLKSLDSLQDGDPSEMKKHLAARIPKIAKTRDLKQRSKRAGNMLIGMAQCGLIEIRGTRITGLLNLWLSSRTC